MQNDTLRASILPVCAVIALLVLIVSPLTGWIVGAQMRAEFDLSPPTTIGDRIQQSARRHPGDLDAAIAAALYRDPQPATVDAQGRDYDGQLQDLNTLIDRHPDQARLYAHALRVMTGDRIKIQRTEELTTAGKQAQNSEPLTTPDEADLTHFVGLATTGAKLDPDNAYFPAMRAVAMFAAHRDNEGLAALHRAAALPNWRSYCADAIRTAVRLQAEAGSMGAFAQMVPVATTLYPQFAQMRSAIRMAAYLAEQYEAQGDRASGLKIRRDILRLGILMRDKDPSAIGALVGVALTAIASSHPAGTPVFTDSANLSAEERRVRNQQRYTDYLIAQGWQTDADRYDAEMEKGWKIKQLIDRGSALSAINTMAPSLPIYWGVNLFLLSNLLVLLVCHLLLQLPLNARALPVARFMALALVALWQWRVFATWCISLLLVAANLQEKPAPIPGAIAFTTLVPACFIALSLINRLMKRRAKRLRAYDAMELRRQRHGLVGATAGVLCLLYVASVCVTAIKERELRICLDRTLQNEGRYFAELCGKRWPAN